MGDGIYLCEYWFSVSNREQYDRFQYRLNGPLRQWKLSPTDLGSTSRWEDYSCAKGKMLIRIGTATCPWYHVPSDSKEAVRLNMISYFLGSIPYTDMIDESTPIRLPDRPPSTGYVRPPPATSQYVPDHTAEVVAPVRRGESPFVSPNTPVEPERKSKRKKKKYHKDRGLLRGKWHKPE